MGIPLVRDPLQGDPSLFFPSAPKSPVPQRSQHQPYQPPPWSGRLPSPSRAPSYAQHRSSKALSCSPRSRERAPLTEGDTETPGNPFYPLLATAKSPQSPQTECLNRPGNPLTHPSHSGSPHPHPRRWSPSRGFHPSPPQESSPARRLLRLLVVVVVAAAATAVVAGSLPLGHHEVDTVGQD